MRQINDDFTLIIRSAPKHNYHNDALLYMSKQTLEEIRVAMISNPEPLGPSTWNHNPIGQMFGIPIMLHYAIPVGRWELVQRGTGAYITSGNVWQLESSALKGKRDEITAFAALVVAELEKAMEGTDGGYPDGVSTAITVVEISAEKFALARQGQDHFSECCFNPLSPVHRERHQ